MIGPRRDLFQHPERVAGCMDGVGFASSIINMGPGHARELAIYQQASLGNVPDFLRRGIPVAVYAGSHRGVFWVMPDYFAIGHDQNFVRFPMRPTTAQRIANAFSACLPTRKMVNDIWKALPFHLEPKPLNWKGPMRSVTYVLDHNDEIQRALMQRPPELGVAGHKKDIVVARRRPSGNVAIYGWHRMTGKPIQGPQIQMSAHDIKYEDYSHGVRLVHHIMEVNDEPRYVEDILTDPELSALLSDEGTYRKEDTRYPSEI